MMASGGYRTVMPVIDRNAYANALENQTSESSASREIKQSQL
jgi:hypothetical protein